MPSQNLDEDDQGAAAELIDRLIRSEEGVGPTKLSADLSYAIPHDSFAYAQLSVTESRIVELVNVSFPDTTLQRHGLVRENRECAVLLSWFAGRAPVCWEGVRETVLHESQWRAGARTEGSIPLVFHAQLDPAGTYGIGFCFGGVPRHSLSRSVSVLRLITPYLYARLARTFWTPSPAHASRLLTPREIQVIEWMYYGKTNEEIATLLGNSIYTVKNHVQKILLKLSVNNRTQAVLRAIAAGLVKYPESDRDTD